VRTPAFSSGQIGAAVSLASLVQGGFVALLIVTQGVKGFVPKAEPPPREIAIAVKPMLDLPLLKKGGKPKASKLPDMWKPPKQVKRVEQPAKVPTPLAPKTVEAIPEKKDEEKEKKPPKPDEKPPPDEAPPPPDAPVAKSVEEMIKQMQQEATEEDGPDAPEEGDVNGAQEGTETDPLKARAVDLYRLKLISWFKQGFSAPIDKIDCSVLRHLKASVHANVAPDGTVESYELTSSGDPVFDATVRQVMDARVGQKVPPPPPNYPDILDRVVLPTFQGKNEKCK
jgi:outer membrane biosynthesis protein TonB